MTNPKTRSLGYEVESDGTISHAEVWKKPRKRKKKTVAQKAFDYTKSFLHHMETVPRDDARFLMRLAYKAGHESGRRKR